MADRAPRRRIGVFIANRWGAGAAIFTRGRAWARALRLEMSGGMVGIDVPIPVAMACYSFGGWKASSFGDSHARARGPLLLHARQGCQLALARGDRREDRLTFPTAT